jgi:thermostable 8-oxoguanine DNA glycosylase
MELIWKLSDSDINKVRDYVNTNKNQNVERIINRNINHIDRIIDKDSLLRTMLICLLSSETDSYPENKIEQMLIKRPSLLNYQYLFKVRNIEFLLQQVFQTFGITKYVNKVPKYFSTNFEFLEESDWILESDLNRSLEQELTKFDERRLADMVDKSFKGFGSKEARCFLLALGVTKYEIPIDFKLIKWLENFCFPIKFSKTALQDVLFYHFVSDGIQKLCEISEIYPCILYTSILPGSEVLRKENS